MRAAVGSAGGGLRDKDYGEEIEEGLEVFDERVEDDFEEEEEGGSFEMIVILIIAFVVFKIIRGLPIFKKSVPDWNKSIQFKTVDKSNAEIGGDLFQMLKIVVLFSILLMIAKIPLFDVK